jgi:hypothetical protein
MSGSGMGATDLEIVFVPSLTLLAQTWETGAEPQAGLSTLQSSARTPALPPALPSRSAHQPPDAGLTRS